MHRSNLHLFDGNEATLVREPAGASEGNESVHYFGFRQAILHNQEAGTHAWQWHFKVKWAYLVSPEENCRTRILHGQGQGNKLICHILANQYSQAVLGVLQNYFVVI